ncbi:bifunctional acetate--CoA ligase family protein/GNAT family N-acetyltransferase [Roseiconus lacunae]|uniref:bifunctional acetate--CoA ligase family protein/GNAT family N-acetyltransferase n=1 Tax=Roseiconus lacunae TaxID=2605694 RepID=UPI001E61E337|nr:bifunctional acetate--CoA ligase family protein/GNAT family N-acetyltransferase [Roseiconus lacunae]MCD0462236.1 bifunctional acetate--CoA ligase family protein/GNAT family N-acetyltransferase [Roseiconus lacunae]
MPVRNLEKIFAAKSVAVIGASDRPLSVGQTVLQNLVEGGYRGTVFPVNPNHQELQGLPCFSSVEQLPIVADLAIICTPAKTVPHIVRQCGEAGILGLVILSAGFREVSKEGGALEQKVLSIAKKFRGMRIIGPNCLGFMTPHLSLNASFASDLPLEGHVAFISQSGALCTAVLDWAMQENVGFSHFVSIGNMLDVGIADLIDYFALDNRTESIILYVESIDEARRFMSAARAFTRTKPIIAYKAGRFAESAQAAASHTGAMAGVDSVYEAAMARAGIVRVFEVDDLFNCAELLARQTPPSGPRLAIITNAGGPGVMATDALLERHGVLADLSHHTLETLNNQLPAAWSHGNPVDVLGDAPPSRFEAAVKTVLTDPGVDGVLVVLSPQAMTDPAGAARAVIKATRKSGKPVLAAWMGGRKVRAGIELLNQAGVATYSTPEKCVRAFMHLVTFARNREMLYETPREIPIEFSLDRARLRDVSTSILNEGGNVLSEVASKALLEAYEIPVTPTLVATSSEDAVGHAMHVGYPVALKIFSPDITHKSDVGGVELNLATSEDVIAAFNRILSRAKRCRPGARIDGVTVQPMVVEPNGRELIVGAKRDPVFGTVLLVGAGGTNAELFHDRALELPPLSENLARRMLESLQSWPLLREYRGRPAVDLDQLIKVLMRLSYLVADCPKIAELDVNPLLATPDGVVALDARIVLDEHTTIDSTRPYSHLAIRPYPHEYIRTAVLNDGTTVRFRPIKPEDEKLWCDFVGNCSPESLHLRFRYMFKATTHEMASRFCFIDYDREIAVVAETEHQGKRKLIGIGRLVADVDHREAEYAVLVADQWQSLGIGSQLTDYCLQLCEDWGVESIIAEMAPGNRKMIRMFEHRGFQIDRMFGNDVVIARRNVIAQEPIAPVTTVDRLD